MVQFGRQNLQMPHPSNVLRQSNPNIQTLQVMPPLSAAPVGPQMNVAFQNAFKMMPKQVRKDDTEQKTDGNVQTDQNNDNTGPINDFLQRFQ